MNNSENENDKFLSHIKYEELEWSKDEMAVRYMRSHREDIFSKYVLNFSDALILKLRKSVMGPYLDILNYQQIQDKSLNENKLRITNYDLKNIGGKEYEIFEKNNSILDDSTGILKTLVTYQNAVEYKYIQKTIKFLRIHEFYVNIIDRDLRRFRNLQVLVLSGNNLREIEGSFLPRGLKFLELYDNFIQDIIKLVNEVPKYLVHLGMGRNMLDDNSSLNLLAESGNFLRLRSLDLSDNDICDLTKILLETKKLASMRSLKLEGNPCYVDKNYKNTTIYHIPRMLFLDDIEISMTDRSAEEISVDDTNRTPHIIFYCHRLMGLRHPPKDKKNSQTIHLEIKLPLLERISNQSSRTGESEKISENIDGRAQTAKITKAENNERERKRKTTNKTSPYDGPDEYDSQLEECNVSFKTEKLPWSHVMQFLPIFIEAPHGDTLLIRDTLRTRVKVDVVYMKAPKNKGKKGKSIGKKMNNKTESTTIRSGQSVSKTPKETISKKITLFSFYCNLHSINWSDNTIDYIWMDHPKFGEDGLKTNCLKDLVYSGNKKVKKLKQNEESKNIGDFATPHPIPKMFTCHVGFGLERS